MLLAWQIVTVLMVVPLGFLGYKLVRYSASHCDDAQEMTGRSMWGYRIIALLGCFIYANGIVPFAGSVQNFQFVLGPFVLLLLGSAIMLAVIFRARRLLRMFQKPS